MHYPMVSLVLAIVSVSCAESEEQPTPTPTPVTTAVIEEMATTPVEKSKPQADAPPTLAASCTPPPQITGVELTARWPQLIGRHVRLAARIESAIDFTSVLASANGRRLVIAMPPATIWSGVQSQHTFLILGSVTAPLGGRLVLPHVLLDDEASCPQ